MSSPTPNRRNGTSPTKSSTVPTKNPHTSPSSTSQPLSQPVFPPSLLSTLLPTPAEAVFLAIFPATLVLGSLFSLLNPTARAAPYNRLSQSHTPTLAPSYFAQKHNVFNLFFVKIGWFWTSLAFFAFLASSASSATGLRTPASILARRRAQAVLRWGLVTAWWVLVTQWCFGPGLIERGFRLTGGGCVGAFEDGVTSQVCKMQGGRWEGGYDVSGHVFLLTLGSVFLGLEVLPVWGRGRGWTEERLVRGEDGAVAKPELLGSGDEGVGGGLWAVAGLGGLWLWMLFMTAAYFHTWLEKFTGLVCALWGVALVYYLPRAMSQVRNVLGMPGV